MSLIEVCKAVALVLWEVFILEVTETNHVVATPEFVEELATTLHVDVVESGLTSDGRCIYVAANLVEETSCTALSTANERFSLHKQHVGITEDGHIVRLMTTIRIVTVAYKPLHGAIALTPAFKVVTYVIRLNVASNGDGLREDETIALLVLSYLVSRKQCCGIINIDNAIGIRTISLAMSGE